MSIRADSMQQNIWSCWKSIEVNVLCCTPTEYRLMAKLSNLDDYNLNALHSTVSAGEPLNREVIDKFRHHFDVTVRDGYGQTESTLLLGFLKGMEVRPGSMGKPTPGNDVVIIDEDGELVKTGEVGDIAIPLDTAALFKGYYKDEEKRKEPSAEIIMLPEIVQAWMRTAISGLKEEAMILLSAPAIRLDPLKWRIRS